MKSLTLCPISVGSRLIGCAKTPEILLKKLSKIYKNLKVYDVKINNAYHEKNSYQNLLNTMTYCESFYYMNMIALNNSDLNINIGGDHSLAIGTIAASSEKYKDDLKVLFIDAHPDINNLQYSKTKNIHGMPVNFLMFEKSYQYGSWLYDNQIKPSQIIYIGLRDFDDYERKLLQEHNIEYYTPQNLHINMNNIIRKLNEKKIHLSFDVDGIDPKYFPSTGTPSPNGLEMSDVHFLVNNIKDNIVNCDFTELNLDLGSDEQKNVSIHNSLEFFELLLK